MTDQRISTEEAERIAFAIQGRAMEVTGAGELVYDEELRAAAAALRSLAAERDALREAMETATDCCARATACGRILRDALGENQP